MVFNAGIMKTHCKSQTQHQSKSGRSCNPSQRHDTQMLAGVSAGVMAKTSKTRKWWNGMLPKVRKDRRSERLRKIFYNLYEQSCDEIPK